MVVKLTGKVNGQDVVLNRGKGDVWTAIIPPTLSGKYAVEFMAWDDSGNMSYMAKMLFTVDTDNLCVHLEPYPYYAEVQPDTYYCEVVDPPLCGGRR